MDQETWAERAAIIEYQGNVPRADAERLARLQLDAQRHQDRTRVGARCRCPDCHAAGRSTVLG